MSNPNDERHTPPELFAELAARFGPFDFDAAASRENALCARYATREYTDPRLTPGAVACWNGLECAWSGYRVFVNPPYSQIPRWVEKAHRESDQAHNITMLIPANRCEQPFWHEFVEPYRDGRMLGFRNKTLTTHFLPKRRSFIHPVTGKMGSPMFGLVVLHWSNHV